MMRGKAIGWVVGIALALGSVGCAGTYAVSAGYSAPNLVYVGPGIWVVADYDHPVFYSDDYYWWYMNRVWYRSYTLYNPQYVRVGVNIVPYRVRTIDRPRSYVRYRAPANARVRRAPERRSNQRNERRAPERRAPERRQQPQRHEQRDYNRATPSRSTPSRSTPSRGTPSRGREGGEQRR